MKPTSIILDLLRTYGTRGTSVQEITATGGLFGFNSNRIRVSLSRLAARGVIENYQRGHYRLCETADPINQFAERWRMGEARVKPWQGDWLCIHLPAAHSASTRSSWALTHFGFVTIDDHFWIRPDNLAVSGEALRNQLQSLGLAIGAVVVTAARLMPDISARWLEAFEPNQLQQRYLNMTSALETSMQQLPRLDKSLAKKESFQLGGQGIQLLAKDPLLPEQWLDPAARKALWHTMCRYDEVGRQVWTSEHKPDVTPISQTEFTNTEMSGSEFASPSPGNRKPGEPKSKKSKPTKSESTKVGICL
tara:strand:- start:496 stop:1413 length:918 start_codon:yes stop_codon:yes gene_type:complete